MEAKFEKIKKETEKKLKCSAHDMEHIMRVYNTAMKIAKKEKEVDYAVLKAAVLLHDIGRTKEDQDKTGKICHAKESARMCQPILKKLGFSSDKIIKIKHCILTHRYKTNNKPRTLEAKILFDADKLDALGAIMLMRAGMWLQRNGASIFPKMKLKDYIKNNLVGGKINGRIKDNSQHSLFYEYEIKNKKLPHLMNTKMGKEMAKERLAFNSIFLARLKKEAKGAL